MIQGQQITKSFGNLQVLKGIDIRIPASKIVSIVGASGAGKTTLLQILGTLSRPTGGKIFIEGQEVSRLNEKELSQFRNRNIGFVFQFHHLLPEFTALENVCIPAYIRNSPKVKTEQKAKELLSFLGLEERMSHKPDELSGGEQQRVSVARALINDPKVIFADEPSGNLDSKNKQELHSLFFTLRDTFKQTFVIVTHDAGLAGMSDIQYEMADGKMVGKTELAAEINI
ncbi:MAG: ABC transporter ATP-binding protein [Bacteroidales bacterium]|jgi:lipoprotein-releasing system ATP-binding protein|nr:ABC transporter ATP-binding protein [Bacteroidales bacterium]